MAKGFFERLGSYYDNVAKVLKGEADVASIFPNTSDIGISREKVYVDFLIRHAPSKCNVFLGGFLFGANGSESRQLDVLITTDTAPRFNFFSADGNGKSFAPVDGCIGVASVKSTLDKAQLEDSLNGIASIPETRGLGNAANPLLHIASYDNWPYKIIYASDGLASDTILSHIRNYYLVNSTIPLTRRPDIIHVAGKYVIVRIKPGMVVHSSDGTTVVLPNGDFHVFVTNSDRLAITWTIDELQKIASTSTHILFDYSFIIDELFKA